MPALPRLDQVMGKHRGLHAAAAHLVECGTRHGLGQPGTYGRLTAGSLALPRLQHIAHDQFLDGVARQAGAFHRRLYRRRAKLNRAKVGQIPHHAAHWRARGGDDDDRIG
jgi:hypothetical protein